MRKSGLLLGLAPAFTSLALLAACGGSPAAPASRAQESAALTQPGGASGKPATSIAAAPAAGPATARPHIRTAWVALTSGQVPSWIANDAGYFAKYGLDTDLTYIEGSSKATAAMIGGSLDITEMAGEATIISQSKGADVVIVGALNNYSPFKLLARPGINTVADLKGKTVASSAGGSADEFVLAKVLAMNGIVSGRDVKVTYIGGDVPARLAALKAGRIDGMLASIDSSRPGIRDGAVVLVDTVPLKIPHPQNTLVTTRTYLKSHRTEVLNFLKAEAEAVHRFKTDRSLAEKVIGKYMKTDDREILDDAFVGFSQLIPDDLQISRDAIANVMEQDKIAAHNPEDFYDMSLADELKTSGFLASVGVK